jgi:hypothetical protein
MVFLQVKMKKNARTISSTVPAFLYIKVKKINARTINSSILIHKSEKKRQNN